MENSGCLARCLRLPFALTNFNLLFEDLLLHRLCVGRHRPQSHMAGVELLPRGAEDRQRLYFARWCEIQHSTPGATAVPSGGGMSPAHPASLGGLDLQGEPGSPEEEAQQPTHLQVHGDGDGSHQDSAAIPRGTAGCLLL